MAGTIIRDAGDLCFVGRYGFMEGTSYAVEVDGVAAAILERPSAHHEATTDVVAIRPSASEVPRNLLRFYVHFSAPMSEGFAARHVRLVDDHGAPLPDALLPMAHELWDPERRRLTVLLDPARIKRGLAAHRAIGYPLHQGRAFTVVVDATFRDARGAPLRAGAEQHYAVAEDVRRRVDPARWSLARPRSTSPEPLVVEFDRPLDAGLLARCLRVVGPDGKPLRGTARTGPEERSWQLTPAQPWAPQPHHVVVDAVLEDVAGNSVRRVFDRQLGRPQDEPVVASEVRLTFTPR